MSYSKLHSTIVNSSLWTESDAVRILFITLLAMCDKDGCVYGSRPGLERIAQIEPSDADGAWMTLLSPDKHSSDKMRAPENEGRRIEEIPGGFRLLNFAYYRGLRNDDDRREQNRAAQARFKARVSQGKPSSAAVSHGNPPKAHTEAEAEAEEKKNNTPLPPRELFTLTANAVEPQDMVEAIYKAYPLKVGKPGAIKAIRKAAAKHGHNLLLEKTKAYATAKSGDKSFVPHPSKWFNEERFNDDPSTWVNNNNQKPGPKSPDYDKENW